MAYHFMRFLVFSVVLFGRHAVFSVFGLLMLLVASVIMLAPSVSTHTSTPAPANTYWDNQCSEYLRLHPKAHYEYVLPDKSMVYVYMGNEVMPCDADLVR